MDHVMNILFQYNIPTGKVAMLSTCQYSVKVKKTPCNQSFQANKWYLPTQAEPFSNTMHRGKLDLYDYRSAVKIST